MFEEATWSEESVRGFCALHSGQGNSLKYTNRVAPPSPPQFSVGLSGWAAILLFLLVVSNNVSAQSTPLSSNRAGIHPTSDESRPRRKASKVLGFDQIQARLTPWAI